MKKLVLSLLTLCVAFAGLAADEVIRRGAAIPAKANSVALAEILAQPEQFTKTNVVTEGTVEAVCQNKGCWMQLTAEPGKPGIRVTFKDYGFFVPKDSRNMSARLEGIVKVKTLSRADADHLEEEGVKLSRREDGTAIETSFIASGVELRRR
jgi:hypothetical protein